MSWSIEEHIGEGRPWPEQVVVYRGETDESLTYARRSLSDVNKMVELMDTLAAENAKLRELVEDMWFWHYEGHIDSESQERQMLHIDAVIQRMRELGVEVTS